MEQWQIVTGFPNYSVSNYGNIKNNTSGKILCPYIRKGYSMVSLRDKLAKLKKQARVHRLVAIEFVSNPNNYDCINHKDEIRNNNHYTNLEWCDHQYNNTYGTRIQKQVKSLKINWSKRSRK